jgi:hypothetical protein
LLRIKRSLDYVHVNFSILLGVFQLLAAVAQAEPGQRFVDRNARQPGRKGRATGKLVKVLIRPNVCILHYVFGLGIIAQDRARDTIEPLVVPAHDCPIDGGVALYDHLPQPAMTRIVTASVDVA